MDSDKKKQFNLMLNVLTHIAKNFQTYYELQENAERDYGIDYVEALEMAYDNIQFQAKFAIQGIKHIE